MNVRRVLVLSITFLAAGASGYALLGLKVPKRPAVARAAQVQDGGRATIIAVGPDGRVYAIRAPASAAGRSFGGFERDDRGGFDHGYRDE